ncbi:MAG: carbohydrate-binding family 9-like protein [Acidobacteria bacterium]|nr:carbohydrate-binding family 9-like protein [Acidobacteriota bacterium]MCA1637470.1 carbohydrate-binding family 9-like protein [Acidobacteriota bacterium]
MNRLKVSYTSRDFSIGDFENDVWQSTEETSLHLYWSGALAETERHAKARLVWSEDGLFARFEGNQRERLIVNSEPNTKEKSIGLWERDVFEIFVSPDSKKFERYFEFEAAPTGEWLDIKIEILPNGERKADFDYNSKMKVVAKILENKVVAAMKIDWRAFGRKPRNGAIWRGNLFRCIGIGKNRGYLAWQPTRTKMPNFHVPEKFGYFEFVKD